jgi:hypothetical protein
MAQFADNVEEWAAITAGVSRWEDENLLDNPTPEKLKEHKDGLMLLIRLGKFLSLATEQETFTDRAIVEMVEANLQVLKDKLRLFHGGPMDAMRSKEILASCFPNES